MKRAAFIFGILLFAAVISAAIATATWIFWEAWRGADRDVFKALLGGFSGAFFAFTFVRMADWLKRLADRLEKDHSAVMRIQHYLNDCLGITGDNIFVIDDFLAIVSEERLNSGIAPVYMNRFKQYPIDRDVLIDLSNVEFVNEIYWFNGSLRKLNDDLATADRAMDEATKTFIANPERFEESYIESMKRTRRRYAEVKGFLEQLSESAIRNLATSRLLIEHAPFSVTWVRLLTRRKYSKGFRAALPAQIAATKAEIEELRVQSNREISEALARSAKSGK